MNVQDPLMPMAEVAQTLKCSERTLERLVRAGSFPPPLGHSKQTLWFELVVQAWLQRQREAQLAWTSPNPGLHQPELPPAVKTQASNALAVAEAGDEPQPWRAAPAVATVAVQAPAPRPAARKPPSGARNSRPTAGTPARP